MPTNVTNLGLRNPEIDAVLLSTLNEALDEMLSLLKDLTPEFEESATTEFHASIDEYRSFFESASNPLEIREKLDRCLEECRAFFDRSETTQAENLREITSLVNVVREALATVAGGSESFNAEMQASSERFTALTKVDDLGQLKILLAREVSELTKVVSERQKQEEEWYGSLIKRVEGLQTQLAKTREEASLDGLTQVANRRTFDRTLKRLIRAKPENLSLAIVDVDDFKKVNDQHGHQVGDRVLMCAAQALFKSVRSSDLVARIGGEEFGVILQGMPLGQAEARCAGIVSKVAGARYHYQKGDERPYVRFTISCGLTACRPDDTPESLIHRADEALYAAKRQGKNRVVVSSD